MSTTETHQFSRLTESRLRKAGWYPGRQTDVSPFVEQWQAAGFYVNTPAISFLTEFGALQVSDDDSTEKPSPAWALYDRVRRTILMESPRTHILVDTSADAILRETDALDLEQFYDMIAGSRLCPVGYARHMQESILVDRQGAVFSGWCGQHISFIGARLDKALEWMIAKSADNACPPRGLAMLHPSGIEHYSRYDPP